MPFELKPYIAPDFTREDLRLAPEAALVPAPKDGVAPENYHELSIFP